MNNEHPAHVTVTQGVRGWFAVLVVWCDDFGGFYEPENSGVGSYATRDDPGLVEEGASWAASEGVEFRP